MSYKLQIANQDTEKWEDINHSNLDDLTEGEAGRIARQKNELGPYTYRPVPVDCPQEPLTKNEDGEVQEA